MSLFVNGRLFSIKNRTNVDILLFKVNSSANYTVSEDMEVTPKEAVMIPLDVYGCVALPSEAMI
jgi:hypothetical protein